MYGIRFDRLVGRVRTLRVPARRLGALTRGASLDVRIVPLWMCVASRSLHLE